LQLVDSKWRGWCRLFAASKAKLELFSDNLIYVKRPLVDRRSIELRLSCLVGNDARCYETRHSLIGKALPYDPDIRLQLVSTVLQSKKASDRMELALGGLSEVSSGLSKAG
jgi:hypothetical protein